MLYAILHLSKINGFYRHAEDAQKNQFVLFHQKCLLGFPFCYSHKVIPAWCYHTVIIRNIYIYLSEVSVFRIITVLAEEEQTANLACSLSNVV